MDIVGAELVLHLGLLGRNAYGHYAERDNVFWQAQDTLYLCYTLHVGMNSGPNRSETHAVCGQQQVLRSRRDIVNPESCHIALYCFAEVTTGHDSAGRMVASARERQLLAQTGDDALVSDYDESPRLFVDGRRGCHSGPKERVDLLGRDLLARELTHAYARHNVVIDFVFHTVWLFAAPDKCYCRQCKKDETFH